jgi:hypothetical protein
VSEKERRTMRGPPAVARVLMLLRTLAEATEPAEMQPASTVTRAHGKKAGNAPKSPKLVGTKPHKHKSSGISAGEASGKQHGEGGGGVRNAAARVRALLQLSAKHPVIHSTEDLARIAAAVATERRELMFTTVSIDRPLHQLIFLRQWYGNLRGSAAHAMLIGADARTCRAALNATIPCFVDAAAPALRGKQNQFGHQVLLKWWYAKQMLALDYHIVFSDPDIAWLSDPFAKWDTSFDLQGLSDIRHVNVTTQKHHEITCLRPWMEQMYEHSRRSIYPCQSTGLWFMRNRPQSRALLDGLYRYLEAKPNEWEQKAFQLIVMRYLVGLGDDLAPLRYRLLPTTQFINIEYYEERKRLGLDASQMIGVHCGYLKNT